MVAAFTPGAVLVSAGPAAAAEPTAVSVTLSGCRNDGTIALPNSSGAFICPDAAYTTGNLGKGWNELDLVPYRVKLNAGNSAPTTQTYTVAYAVDRKDGGADGYDVLSVATLNTALSAASCSAPTVGAATTMNPGLGGISETLFRTLTITQSKSTSCTYDFYARLALGSHLFPGSSLHANMGLPVTSSTITTSGIGARDVSIPVKEISPQELSKTMQATQGSAFNWSLNKTSTPLTLGLGNTCDVTNPRTGNVRVEVTWTRIGPAPAGTILVTTSIIATNPASRVITVNVSDAIRSGSILLDTLTSGPIDVAANSSQTVLTHTFTVPSGTTDLNDVATATYTDRVTQVAVPGTTTATASATPTSSGSATDSTAVITDVETLTGTAFDFKVDSVSGASGTFGAGYTPGTYIKGPLTWTSDTQSVSGGVTFVKTVRSTSATVATGSLSDEATLNGSDGIVRTASASTELTASALTSLAVSKTMNQRFSTAKTFTFALFSGTAGSGTDTGRSTTVTIPAGSTGPVTSASLGGLDPSLSYYFEEAATAPFPAQTTSGAGFTLVPGDLSSCSATIITANSAAPATARVQKVTDPIGGTSWAFTLTGPGGLSETKNAVAGAGYVPFSAALDADGGTYTITESTQTGWDNTGAAGDLSGSSSRVTTSIVTHTCSFVLNLTTDADGLLSCTFTNTQRGSISIHKTVSGAAPTGTDAFTFQLRQGASTASNGTTLDSQVANAGNSGNLDFSVGGSTALVPGSYQVCEFVMVGWTSSLQTATGAFAPGTGGDTTADNTYVCVPLTLAAGQSVTLNVDNVRPPGGMAKTIGFWKNWASCNASNGKQRPILDQTLTAAGGSIFIGTRNVTTCAVAVDLLDKRNLANLTLVGDGKKMASDPAWNVAAQLLAYRLNIVAGAGDKAAANAAAADAQAILVAIGFDGLSRGPISAAQKAALNNDAAVLDSYNNNTL